jgi:phosphopantothenoylcysteine decarboxylase/phosphopantothenate--cysteine ligase
MERGHVTPSMKVIVTCGPSYEPIDGVRRLTNMSTGKLGVTLANYLTDAGHAVICLKGEGSTFPGTVRAARVEMFSTNDDLARQLELISQKEDVGAVFHAAALCDYRVEKVLNGAGEEIASRKFATRDGRLQLVLAPATKILPKLRGWFPQARIVGWKYELAGTRDAAIAKARKQMRDCQTNACVLNGAAYGEGFAFCHPDEKVETCADGPGLSARLHDWLQGGSSVVTSLPAVKTPRSHPLD